MAKKIYKAFFPGYLFVHLDLEKDRWQKINSTIGVNKIISFGSYPISISERNANPNIVQNAGY